jgi:hypothetical protein
MIDSGGGEAAAALWCRCRSVPGRCVSGTASLQADHDADPEERTLAFAPQDAAFHRGNLPCTTHASGPPPVIAPAPPAPLCPTPRTAPSIAANRLPSSNEHSEARILRPISSEGVRLRKRNQGPDPLPLQLPHPNRNPNRNHILNHLALNAAEPKRAPEEDYDYDYDYD